VFVVVDTNQTLAANRLMAFVNGVEPSWLTYDLFTDAYKNQPVRTPDVVAWGAGYSSGGALNTWADGVLGNAALISGTIPAVSDVYNAAKGKPKDLRHLTGLHSLLYTNGTDAITKDYVLSPAWTNNNTAVKTASLPW
jgi:hypothetical protein